MNQMDAILDPDNRIMAQQVVLLDHALCLQSFEASQVMALNLLSDFNLNGHGIPGEF